MATARAGDGATEELRAALAEPWAREWRGLQPGGASLAVRRCACISFHWMEHPLFPRLHVARIVSPSGDDEHAIIEDAGSASSLRKGMGCRLSWRSPMFFSRDAEVLRAVKGWMRKPGHIFAWSLFDDEAMLPPSWPTMEGVSPWRPSVVVEAFRGELACGLLDGAPEDWGVEAMEAMLDKHELEELGKMEQAECRTSSGVAVFCPASWWGARPKPAAPVWESGCPQGRKPVHLGGR